MSAAHVWAAALARLHGRRPVVALGNFDGVHLGHRRLLSLARERADQLAAPLLVISFFPPAKVLFGGAPYLSSAEEKRALLLEVGADEVAILPFDHELAATPAEDFAGLLSALAPCLLVVGEDFRFGHDRAGGLDLLRRSVQHLEVVALELVGTEVAKSSAIREALLGGDLPRAEALLGAPYRISGLVQHGDQRGRLLGYPTANLHVDPGKALPLGVFAVAVDTPRRRHGGMANLGTRPTVGDGATLVEAHLFGTAMDLYDQPITVHLLAFLRASRRFDGLEALKAQLTVDESAARQAGLARGAPWWPAADGEGAVASGASARDSDGSPERR